MLLLAVETSCDETSAAVVRDGVVLANEVSSQIAIHREYGGVVPELASREHLKNWTPVVRTALRRAGVSVERMEGFAATCAPGLPNALMVGLKAAQGLAFCLGRPFIAVHHHEAHLFSPWIKTDGDLARVELDALEPSVCLIVSGGHTLLAHIRNERSVSILGRTLDDAAGECFDKVAKLIGLPYPGGPALERCARNGDAGRFPFPRPLLKDPGDDFSFSGLKTAVRYFLRDHPLDFENDTILADFCASVQAAIVETLAVKTARAARRLGVRCVALCGGVACNRSLRSRLSGLCREAGLEARFAEPEFCTDNAAMIGVLAERKLLRGERSSLDHEIAPNRSLTSLSFANEQ